MQLFYTYTIQKNEDDRIINLETQNHALLFYVINFKEWVDTIIRIVSAQEGDICLDL